MKLRWDREADIASLDLVDSIPAGGVSTTCAIPPDWVLDYMVNLDFDESGVLLSIELYPASAILPKELLGDADIATDRR